VVSLAILTLYAIRQYALALNRLRPGRRRYSASQENAIELSGYYMPRLTVIVPMHNEERVAADILRALTECDYDPDRLQVIAANDRSSDRTAAIIDRFAARHPFILPFHRTSGKPGKPGVLNDATPLITGEILLLFDADYIPGRNLLKLLAAPFADPAVGAVMGRVVPQNTGESLLSSLLCLERAAGYQVVQESRAMMGFSAQFGGTVGGVRMEALEAAGGWNIDTLTEDTDLTCRLILKGWKVAYVNRAECYEEVPASWSVRSVQLSRWVVGHTDCFHRFALPILRDRRLPLAERIDLFFLLSGYLTAPLLLLSWIASFLLFFIEPGPLAPGLGAGAAFIGCQMFGNQATFIEMGLAAHMDRARRQAMLIPLSLLSFFASTTSICAALLRYYRSRWFGGPADAWARTQRSRPVAP